MGRKLKKYSRKALLKSPHFASYQRDFLTALLTKDFYTMAEAERIVKAFFEKKE